MIRALICSVFHTLPSFPPSGLGGVIYHRCHCGHEREVHLLPASAIAQSPAHETREGSW